MNVVRSPAQHGGDAIRVARRADFVHHYWPAAGGMPADKRGKRPWPGQGKHKPCRAAGARRPPRQAPGVRAADALVGGPARKLVGTRAIATAMTERRSRSPAQRKGRRARPSAVTPGERTQRPGKRGRRRHCGNLRNSRRTAAAGAGGRRTIAKPFPLAAAEREFWNHAEAETARQNSGFALGARGRDEFPPTSSKGYTKPCPSRHPGPPGRAVIPTFEAR